MVEVTCKLKKEDYLEYYLFAQKKSIKFLKGAGIFWIVLTMLYAISIFNNEINIDELFYDIIFILVLFICGTFFLILSKSMFKKSFEKMYNSNAFLKTEPVITYQFNENNYKVLITSPLGIEESTYSYKMLFSAIENDKYFYLVIANNSSYIISKTVTTSKEIFKIREILQNKLGQKFVIQTSNDTIINPVETLKDKYPGHKEDVTILDEKNENNKDNENK